MLFNQGNVSNTSVIAKGGKVDGSVDGSAPSFSLGVLGKCTVGVLVRAESLARQL